MRHDKKSPHKVIRGDIISHPPGTSVATIIPPRIKYVTRTGDRFLRGGIKFVMTDCPPGSSITEGGICVMGDKLFRDTGTGRKQPRTDVGKKVIDLIENDRAKREFFY